MKYLDYPDSYQNDIIKLTLFEFFRLLDHESPPDYQSKHLLDTLAESGLKIGYPPSYATNEVDV